MDGLVDEVIKLKTKTSFYFKNTNEDIEITKEDEEHYRNNNICGVCEKEILIDKVRDHCHLTGKYRDAAHKSCNINVAQKQSSLIPFVFHNFSNYDCYLFFKKLVVKKVIK